MINFASNLDLDYDCDFQSYRRALIMTRRLHVQKYMFKMEFKQMEGQADGQTLHILFTFPAG